MNRETALKMWVEEAKSAIMKRRTAQRCWGSTLQGSPLDRLREKGPNGSLVSPRDQHADSDHRSIISMLKKYPFLSE